MELLTMITNQIFEQLKTVDRHLTENEFTTKYLKTSRSYLCNRRNKRRDVSNDVLLNLYSELHGIANSWEQVAKTEVDIKRKIRWKEMGEFHFCLAKKVVDSLLERAKQ